MIASALWMTACSGVVALTTPLHTTQLSRMQYPTQMCLRYAIAILCVLTQAHAGPVFLGEWLSRFLRDPISAADRRSAEAAIAKLRAGQIEEAQRTAQQLAPRAVTPELRTLTPLRLADFYGKPLVPLATVGETAQAVSRFTPPQLAVFRDIEDYAGGIFSVRFVPDLVKNISMAERRGIENLMIGLSLLPPQLSYLRNVKPENLITIIGAGVDDPLVAEISEVARREGKTTFFYTDCRRLYGDLCRPETVGSLMAVSGVTLVMEGPNFDKSLFSLTEAILVGRARAGKGAVILISPGDVKYAVQQGAQQIGGHVVLAARSNNPNQ
jgi:hypothetical protein